MTTALLNVTDLMCSRGGLTVFEGVHLTVRPGQLVVLRGPNGSGKTTLLRTLAGLQEPDRGQVDCEPESIAYASHADGLKATLTVEENLQFWAELFGARSIEHAVQSLDLKELLPRQARALSAGQKRRVGLARILVTERPIWAMDEPTVSLDEASVVLFATVLEKHLASGGGAVIATHADFGQQGETIDISKYRPSRSTTGAFDEAIG
ncbi:MAG: heme ABC exporter ATP-binding protein CcmA [Boseongicola sp.]